MFVRAVSVLSRHARLSKRSFAARAVNHYKFPVAVAGTLVAIGLCIPQLQSKEQPAKPRPIYSVRDVAQHKTTSSRIWVTYKNGVYDITDFVEMHPGGLERIMLAAGSSIDSFWSLYQQHLTPQVLAILEEYRIGDLAPNEVTPAPSVADAYANEPKRPGIFRVVSEKPFNAETPPSLLAEKFFTPNDLFFVRNHLPTPAVHSEHYRLIIQGEGIKTLSLSLHDLRTKFPRSTIRATLQCSGNRRLEMAASKPIKGLEWTQGAIGNAEWTGVRLRDVLLYAGYDVATAGDKVAHVQFEGLDADATGTRYGASIPVAKALSENGDVLLAYEMNGVQLPRDHGYPLRVVVPGVTGARSVKWVGKIILSGEESQSHWQQKDYKVFPPQIDWHNVDWSAAPAIQESNVQSAICEPRDGAVIHAESLVDGRLTVRGYAFSGGGRGIQRVDVSPDGGKTWHAASLTRAASPTADRTWDWTLWEAQLPVQDATAEVVVRAVDYACNNQPSDMKSIWNLRGVMNNAWHRVNITVA